MSGKRTVNRRTYPLFVETIRVVDGDTFAIKADPGHGVWFDFNTRLLGYDTPEKTTPAGKAVIAAVNLWLKQTQEDPDVALVWVSRQVDKFGRSLGDLLLCRWSTPNQWGFPVPFASYSKLLIAQKLVKPYSGEGRRDWGMSELLEIEANAKRFLGTLSE